MDFRLLGPLEVVDHGGDSLKLGGRKPRALLARLALDAGRTVSVEQLVDDLWGEDVPESAVKMVHIHVSALRKALPPDTLHTRPPGYALELPEEALDLARFERLRREGREALDERRRRDGRGPVRGRRWSCGGDRRWRSSASRSRSWRPRTCASARRSRSRTGSTPTSRSAATRTWWVSSRASWPSTRCGNGCGRS